MSESFSAPPPWMAALEYRALGERAAMTLSLPVLRQLPKGDGHHVIVLPGFTANDGSTLPLRRLLRDLGYVSHGWRLGQNVGPTPRILDGLGALLDRVHRAGDGESVSIVGWSLGGIYARELARVAPSKVRMVITLGSPIQMDETDQSNAQRMWDALRRFHDPTFKRDVRAAFRPPLEVPATSIYSRTDGVVNWRTSLIRRSDISENIQVYGSHCGLGFNNAAIYAIADRLAQPAGEWARFRAPLWLRPAFPRADRLDITRLPRAA